jgi:CubicO group peptidase (beta-lactamase class C family)
MGEGEGIGGFSARRLAGIGPAMQAYVDRGAVAGVVTLVHRHGRVAHCEGAGWQDEEARLPMRPDTIFRIASMSKPVTSVAVMMLIEEGRLGLADPVERWLPELADRQVLKSLASPLDDTVKAARPITILDLLTHRSGLAYDFTVVGPLADALAELRVFPPRRIDPDSWLRAVAALPLASDPGKRWHYGISTDVLGILVARISGMSFPDFLDARLFGPLEMKDTGFSVPDNRLDRFAVAYAPGKGGGREVDDAPGRSPWRDPAAFPAGGSGLVSTAGDYLKFAHMLIERGRLNGVRYLSPKSIDIMTANHLTPEQRAVPFLGMDFWAGQGFGLGFSVVDDVAKRNAFGDYSSLGTVGWPGAYGTWWAADAKEDMVMLFMIQMLALNPAALAGSGVLGMRPRFQALVYDAIDD